MEVNRQLLETRADAAELLEPADALLGHAAAAVGDAVEPDRRVMPRRLVVLVRDHRLDPLTQQPLAHALNAVGLVAGDLLGLVPTPAAFAAPADQRRDRLADDRLGPRRFVDLPGGDFDGEGSARTVSNHVELRSKPASAAAQCVVGGLVGVPPETFLSAPAAARAARTDEPSTHHSSQSMYPLLSSLTCNASMTAAKTPALRQLRKWSYTVCQGPNRSGRSRQGAPVPRIQKMPLSIRRGQLAGRPVLALLRGISGSTAAHCSSVSSCRRIRADLLPASRPDQQYERDALRFSDRA